MTRIADADTISLASLPHRNMVRRALDILHRIAAGEPYVRFHGKRLRHDRTRISVPLGRHYRLIFHDDGVRLRPIACMSHSAYNGTKPGARRRAPGATADRARRGSALPQRLCPYRRW